METSFRLAPPPTVILYLAGELWDEEAAEPGGEDGDDRSDELVVSVPASGLDARRREPDRLRLPDPIWDETGKGVGVSHLVGVPSSSSSSSCSSVTLTSFNESRGRLEDDNDRT